jgi:hypothetical protein
MPLLQLRLLLFAGSTWWINGTSDTVSRHNERESSIGIMEVTSDRRIADLIHTEAFSLPTAFGQSVLPNGVEEAARERWRARRVEDGALDIPGHHQKLRGLGMVWCVGIGSTRPR